MIALQRDSRERSTPWVLAAALGVYLVGVLRFNFLTDDAFISFRYARNLARGSGLVFNPGEGAPVEGFSNFLWVLALAALDLVGVQPPLASRLLSVAAGALLIALLVRTLARMGLAPAAVFAGALFAALMPPLVLWSTGGLATAPFALLVFVVYLCFLGPGERRGWRAGALAGLAATLIRVDGIGWVLAVLGLALVLSRRDATRRRELWKATLFVAAGLTLFEVGRIAYFGDWLPNTVRAKVGFGAAQAERGTGYLLRFLALFPAVPLILGLVAFQARDRSRPALLGAAALTAVTFVYVVLVGGDFMGMFRFLVPAVPFLAILLASTVDGLRLDGRPSVAWAVTGLALVSAALPLTGYQGHTVFARQLVSGEDAWMPLTELQTIENAARGSRELEALGRFLRIHTEPGDSIVMSAVGATAFYCERTVFDSWALTDAELARQPMPRELTTRGHAKYGDLTWFERRRPTYGFADLVHGSELDWANPKHAWRIFERHGDEALMAVYRPVVIPVPEHEDGGWYLLLARRDPTLDGSPHPWHEPLLASGLHGPEGPTSSSGSALRPSK